MKKYFSVLIVFTLLMGIFLTNSIVYAENNTDKSRTEVDEVLIGYFTNDLEVKSKLKPVVNKYISQGSTLDRYDRLNSSLLADWYNGLEVKVDSYLIDITINSIEEIDHYIKVDLNKKVKLKYRNVDVDSMYIDNHIVYLKNQEGKLLVERDIYEVGLKAKDIDLTYSLSDKYQEYIEEKIALINKRKSDLNNEIRNFKIYSKNTLQSREISPLTYPSYNGDAAATWAINNVQSEEEYPQDCTNFVSKALKQGGLPTDGTWYQGSNAWIRVIELRDWLIGKGYANEYTWQSNSRKGDVVQLYRNGYTNVYGWQHSLIITYINPNGYVFVSAHTNPALNKALWDYYPTPIWSNIRFLKITDY